MPCVSAVLARVYSHRVLIEGATRKNHSWAVHFLHPSTFRAASDESNSSSHKAGQTCSEASRRLQAAVRSAAEGGEITS